MIRLADRWYFYLDGPLYLLAPLGPFVLTIVGATFFIMGAILYAYGKGYERGLGETFG